MNTPHSHLQTRVLTNGVFTSLRSQDEDGEDGGSAAPCRFVAPMMKTTPAGSEKLSDRSEQSLSNVTLPESS